MFLITLISLSVSSVFAEPIDFGGYDARFKGDGDLEPPKCQLNVPSYASAPFTIMWNCEDNECSKDEIKTSLWMLKKGAEVPVKVGEFLGFPAAVNINEELVDQAVFSNALPLSFRLVATDRAGITALSPYATAVFDSGQVKICNLTIKTLQQESTEETTGTPEMTVEVKDARVNSQESGTNLLIINTKSAVLADPCEIDQVCDNDSKVSFRATLSTTSAESNTTGTLTILPGDITLDIEGTVNNEITQVSGETTVEDDIPATVSLECSD